jgi:hypothetical protein
MPYTSPAKGPRARRRRDRARVAPKPWSRALTESAEYRLPKIPVDSVRWKHVGLVQLDEAGLLRFPHVDPVPGIYRFTIGDGADVTQYIGQAARSLRTRFGLYRTRAKRPALPLERKTTSRNARYLLDALRTGHTVRVDLLDDKTAGPYGQTIAIDLTDTALRNRLEKELISQALQAGIKLLNRDGNPGWTQH